MKRILIAFICSLTLLGCEKSDDNQPEFTDNLEGKEFIAPFTEVYNNSIEFYKPGELRFTYKFKEGNEKASLAEYEYYKWKKSGNTGTSIEVTIPKSTNFPESIIKGIVTDGIITFTELPLKGSYRELKK